MARAPRILTFNFHEPYLCLMAKTGLEFDIGVYESGPMVRAWQTQFRPIPGNMHLIPESQWREAGASGRYDVIIAHNEMNAMDVANYPAGRLLVCHNRRSFLHTGVSSDQGDPISALAQLIERLEALYDFVFISASKRDDYGVPGRVILPGIDVEEYRGYMGALPQIARIGNMMFERNLMFDVPFQERACGGLPNAVIGVNPSIPQSAQSDSWEELLGIYRNWRCLLHVSRQEFEDGYNLAMLEAMATGMPVVALSNWSSPIEDGVNGFSSYDPRIVGRRLAQLLGDLDLARTLGARGRETVASRFSIQKFAESWRNAIMECADKPTCAARRPRLAPTGPKRLLFCHRPDSAALAWPLQGKSYSKYHTLQVGNREEAALAPYAPPPLHTTSFGWREVEKVLPQGYQPDLFFVVDTTGSVVNHFLAVPSVAETPRLAAAKKVVLLADNAAAPAVVVTAARVFDKVFVVGLDAPSSFAASISAVSPSSLLEDNLQAFLDEAVSTCLHGAVTLQYPGHQQPAKQSAYYECPRAELLPYIPIGARRLLDVGCGAGAFGRQAKASHQLETVCGIEVVTEAANRARETLDDVWQGDIETMDLPFPKDYFDCIVCADVLEHLSDPALVLRKLSRVLTAEGRFIISIPNARFNEVVAMLTQGAWSYADAGIMDSTHLRFFTKDTLRDLVEQAGLSLLHVSTLSSFRQERLPLGDDRTLQLGKILLREVSDDDYEGLLTYQYLLLAGKSGLDRLAPARAAFENGRHDLAYLLAEDAHGADPHERSALMAKSAAKTGDYDRAETHYRELLATQASPEIAGDLGILLVGLNRLDEAIPLLEQCLAASPGADRAHGALGLALITQRKDADAWMHLCAALEASYENVVLASPFAALGMRCGRLEETAALLARYVDFYPANADIACEYACLLSHLGRRLEALERLELLSFLHPEHGRIQELRRTLANETAE